MPDDTPMIFIENSDARSYIAGLLEDIDTDETNNAARLIKAGKGEMGGLIGDYFYFITKL
jgi:hypothetical protein